MAVRPAWQVKDGTVLRRDFTFVWNAGFAPVQKQKNVRALHASIRAATGETALEVSSKSTLALGRELGAFSLQLDGVPLENAFQAAKKYERGGPYTDLLDVPPREAKRDERHRTSGGLVSFVWGGTEWPLKPETLFYDYIYVTALVKARGEGLDLSEYAWFTDVEFNPGRSVNCQARAAAVYKALQAAGDFSPLKDRERWRAFHESIVLG